MGLLDDAIREHLDLKRRRGADPAEVERAEREALGPVRRNRESVDAAQAPADPDGVDEVAGDDPGFPEGADSFAYDHEADEPDWERDQAETGPPDEDVSEQDLGEDVDSAERAEAPFEPAPPQRPSADIGGHETAEYDVEGALAADDTDDDDVLEETPEFLQDTPDHDRLWFEQRPPRDFDFDG